MQRERSARHMSGWLRRPRAAAQGLGCGAASQREYIKKTFLEDNSPPAGSAGLSARSLQSGEMEARRRIELQSTQAGSPWAPRRGDLPPGAAGACKQYVRMERTLFPGRPPRQPGVRATDPASLPLSGAAG